jgi:hypothetical protein
VRRANDIIWTYMGPRQTPPPLPDIEPNMLPQGEYQVQKVLRECNWFQGLEGDIDTSHLGFLHLGAIKPEQTKPGTFDYYNVADRAPKYEVVDTEFGTSYGAYRPAEADTYYWRIAHFLFPVLHDDPDGHSRDAGARARLGAGGRQPHHVLEHRGAALPRGQRRGGRRSRAQRRRAAGRGGRLAGRGLRVPAGQPGLDREVPPWPRTRTTTT